MAGIPGESHQGPDVFPFHNGPGSSSSDTTPNEDRSPWQERLLELLSQHVQRLEGLGRIEEELKGIRRNLEVPENERSQNTPNTFVDLSQTSNFASAVLNLGIQTKILSDNVNSLNDQIKRSSFNAERAAQVPSAPNAYNEPSPRVAPCPIPAPKQRPACNKTPACNNTPAFTAKPCYGCRRVQSARRRSDVTIICCAWQYPWRRAH